MFRIAGALALAFITLIGIAHAAAVDGATTVAVPVGAWTGEVAGFLGPLVLAFIIWLLRQIPGALVQRLRTQQAEQLLAMAVNYGLNAVAGAAKGKVLSVDVGNQVLAQALGYAVDNGPGKLIGWLGGEDGIRDKILARLTLPEDAAIEDGAVAPAQPKV